MVRFINRGEELGVLEQDWQKNGFGFAILFGRRRIGKTELALEFVKDKEHLYFIAEDTRRHIQIREFKNAIAAYLKDDYLLQAEMEDWSMLFSYLRRVLPTDRKLCLVIDEFSYLIKNDPGLASTLQKFIDTFLKNTNIFLIVAGSSLGLMLEDVLSTSSPLYGRRSRDIRLHGLPFVHAHAFLQGDIATKLQFYFITGGVPEYLLQAASYRSADTFIKTELLSRSGYFYREPYYLLSQEFKEFKTYFAILNALAFGNTRANEIGNFVGINARQIYPYVENLIQLGFVVRETSVVGSGHKGIYTIQDMFFDAWFNIVHPCRQDIERNIANVQQSQLRTYFGKQFEQFIRNEAFRHMQKKYNAVGRWWHKDKEIDIVALNEQEKSILFGECKWQDAVDAETVMKDLVETSQYVQWHTNNRNEEFAVFAKSFDKKIESFGTDAGTVPVRCYDLNDIAASMIT